MQTLNAPLSLKDKRSTSSVDRSNQPTPLIRQLAKDVQAYLESTAQENIARQTYFNTLFDIQTYPMMDDVIHRVSGYFIPETQRSCYTEDDVRVFRDVYSDKTYVFNVTSDTPEGLYNHGLDRHATSMPEIITIDALLITPELAFLDTRPAHLKKQQTAQCYQSFVEETPQPS